MAYPYDAGDLTAISNLGTYYNGNAYNASTNPGGFDNDGHRINFVPCLQDLARVAEAVADAADAAALSASGASTSSATAALSAAKLVGSSTTSLAIGTGSKSFTTQASKFFDVGYNLLAFSAGDPTKYMVGTVTTYSGTSLTINVPTGGTGGSGTVSDWTIAVSGKLGPTGATGSTGSAGATGSAGKAAGYSYSWNTSTSNADPGAGACSTNSGTLSSATVWYISETDADTNPLSAVLATWDNSTSTNKAVVHLYNPLAPANFWDFYITGTLTDNGSWDTFTVTHIASNGSFSNGASLYAVVVPVGDKGDTGATGSTGATGPSGPVLANKWTYQSSGADSDPGAGNFRLAAASPDSPASVTFIYFDNTNSDAVSVTSFLDSLDDSTNLLDRGRITLTDVTTPTIILNYKVTGAVIDGTGYRKVPVTHISGTTFPTVSGLVAVSFAPSGDKGLDGSGAGDVLGPGATVLDDEIATWNGTSGTALQGAGGTKISDLQPKDATLTALAGVSTSADQVIYSTGSDAFSTTSFTAGGRAVAALAGASDKIAYYTGTSTASTTDFTTQARQLLDDTSFSAMRTTLGLAIGTDVQGIDAELSAIAGLTSAADRLPYFTGLGTAALATFTSFARDLADDADAATARTTLGAQQQDAALDSIAGLTTSANQIIYTTAGDTYATTSLVAGSRTFLGSNSAADIGTGTLPDARLSSNALPYGVQSIWIPAGAMTPATTNGAATGTIETAATRPTLSTLDFDTTTVEYAHFCWKMPDQWNRSTVTFKAVWTHGALVTSPDLTGVAWGLCGVAISDLESLNATFGTEVVVTDTTSAAGTANVQYVTAASSAVTIQGQPSPDVIASGDTVYFRVSRVVGNAADTITGDAKLIGIEINITTTKATDA